MNWTGDTDHVDDPTSENTTVTMPAENISLMANFHEHQEPDFTCGDDITFTYNDSEVTYGTISKTYSNNGDQITLCWMDRNLGATRVATYSDDDLAYGDLFQWGRLDDGHQAHNSNITTNQSSTDNPGHGDFIITPLGVFPFDWRNPQNDNLWQGDGGINDPCPDGWRVPTIVELDNERNSWDSNDAAGALGSPLKLPTAGTRRFTDGDVRRFDLGWYWSSNVQETGYGAEVLYFIDDDSFTTGHERSYGHSVRCVKD